MIDAGMMGGVGKRVPDREKRGDGVGDGKDVGYP